MIECYNIVYHVFLTYFRNKPLQEKLSAERLARATAEQEVQHLRACIEERDGKY